MTRYEILLLSSAALRAMRAFPRTSNAGSHLLNWFTGSPLSSDGDLTRTDTATTAQAEWAAMQAQLEHQFKRHKRVRPDALARNCDALSGYLGLSDPEAEIFALATRTARGDPFDRLLDTLVDDARVPVDRAIAILTGRSTSVVRKAIRPNGMLITAGLISREQGRHSNYGLAPSPRLLNAMQPPARGLEDILHGVFVHPDAPDTQWQDFEHLGDARDFTARLLQGALRRGAAGVNLLLYGPPGTGKTELCKALAAQLGAQLFAIGESDDDGDEPTRFERQQQLRLGQSLLSGRKDALVLFDEMEDLIAQPLQALFGGRRPSGSKVHLNRLLENNPVPTLWTTNQISDFDPALLRRMTFTIELSPPPQHVRARVWQRLSRKHRLKIDPEMQAKLAREIEDPPALAANALRAAKLAGGRRKDLDLAVRASARAIRGGRDPAPVPATETRFNPHLTQADTDLDAILERLGAPGAPRAVSLCLSGPPGTGKSAFARHLAEAMDLPVVQIRASDMISPYVGETEAKIAAAFAKARDNGTFLIFDEADSFLATRAMAHRSWEITQVNEMLTWMESHPLPFVCTTNMPDRLDPAALRRFTFRATFGPLTTAQRASAFREFFGIDAPNGLDALHMLTPGDFAVVAKRARVLGIRGARELLVELEREQQAKPGARAPIGFRHA